MSSYIGFLGEAATIYAPRASKVLGVDHWHLDRGFYYYFYYNGKYSYVYIPEGYLTDGASIPRIFWNLLPPWGQYGAAAIVHDYLCEFLEIVVEGYATRITRKEADQILCDAMESLEVPWYPREVIHAAVNGYRIVARVSKPTSVPLRRQLEAEWLKERKPKWQL